MPETQTQETPAREQRGLWGNLSTWFSNRVVDVASVWDQDASDLRGIRGMENRGTAMLSLMRARATDPQQQAQIDAIMRDVNFMGSLDNALKDDNVLNAIVDEVKSDGPNNSNGLLGMMQNGAVRAGMTDILKAVGRDQNDDLDGDELRRMIHLGRDGNLVGLQQEAQRNGIDSGILQGGAFGQSMGIDVMGLANGANGGFMNMLGNFVDNPEQGLASWLNNPNSPLAHLDPNMRAGIASVLQMVIKFFGGAMKDFATDFAELGQHYAPQLVANGNEILAGHNPDASPTRGDGNDVQVADASRPARSGAFARAASGYEAPQSAPESVIAAATVEHPELRQQTMGGQSFSIR